MELTILLLGMVDGKTRTYCPTIVLVLTLYLVYAGTQASEMSHVITVDNRYCVLALGSSHKT